MALIGYFEKYGEKLYPKRFMLGVATVGVFALMSAALYFAPVLETLAFPLFGVLGSIFMLLWGTFLIAIWFGPARGYLRRKEVTGLRKVFGFVDRSLAAFFLVVWFLGAIAFLWAGIASAQGVGARF